MHAPVCAFVRGSLCEGGFTRAYTSLRGDVVRIEERIQGFLDILDSVLSMTPLTHHFLIWAKVKDTDESAFFNVVSEIRLPLPLSVLLVSPN